MSLFVKEDAVASPELTLLSLLIVGIPTLRRRAPIFDFPILSLVMFLRK